MTKPKIVFLIIFALFIVVLNIALYTWNQSLKVFDVPYLVNTPVDRVAFDKQGQIWVSGGGKLGVYEEGVPVHVFTNKDSPVLGGNLSALEVDDKGRVWIVPQGNEKNVDLAVFDGTEWSTILPTSGSYSTLAGHVGIRALAIDSQGRVWIGTQTDIFYSIDGNTWEHIPIASEYVTCIVFDKQGRAWVGGDGLYIFDGKVWQTFTPENSPLLHGGVHAIAFDQQGGAWIASGQAHGVGYFGGVSFFDGKDWIGYPDISTVGFEDIAVDGAGRVWAIMPFGRGVLVFDGKSWKNHKFPVSDVGANLTMDQDGNIWIPSPQNGVAFIPSDSQKYLSPLSNMISLAIASHSLIYLDIFLLGIWFYLAINVWHNTGLSLADLPGYFASKKESMKKINARDTAKGILFGVIGSLVGIIPNAILKTLLIDTFIGDFCFDYTFFKIGWDSNIGISPCGIMSVPMSLMGLFTTLMLFILGGALFGLIGYIIAEKLGRNLGKENWRGAFWWSLIGGVLFDFIFMFTIIFPGY